MMVVQDLVERLRPLVGFKGWDYCVLWKLTRDQRYIEWIGCCCGGADQNPQLVELQFPVIPCRDSMFQHPPSLSCQLLSQLPCSISLDSEIHADALVSNTPKWLNFSTSSDSGASAPDTIGTRTVIPVAGGLVELFVSKQVAEDQNVIEFVTSQCNFLVDQEAAAMMNPMMPNNGINTSISMSTSDNVVGDEHYEHQQSSFLHSDNGHFHPEAALLDSNPVLPFDLSVDRIRLSNSPMNFFQFGEQTRSRIDDRDDDQLFEGGDHDQDHQMINEEQGHSGGGPNHVDEANANGRMGSTSDCSDQVDEQEEDCGKSNKKKGGKGQAKNLQAERRRRKKLNERLYMLRTLVPNITKLDKASILGDAISFVKDLKQQEKELQDELAEPSDDEGFMEDNQLHGLNSTQDTSLSQNGADQFGSRPTFGFLGASNNGSNGNKLDSTHESDAANDKGQQMEPQVEVSQIDGNKFFVKVFCEFKAGGFVRLMEALNSLGFVVTNANVTRVLSLVSNVFQVEKKDTNELVQAEYVRESLLELTRGSIGWLDQMAKSSEFCSNLEYGHHRHLHDPHVHAANSHFHHNHHHNGAA